MYISIVCWVGRVFEIVGFWQLLLVNPPLQLGWAGFRDCRFVGEPAPTFGLGGFSRLSVFGNYCW
ncbi:MAG: hypothetical protein EAZ18_07530 [Oscillatoriales cyanobacterium]|nr:MAG: hypothetical protein EAZ18_07530 [Oscillatoriales cyanobacterium]